MPYYKITSPQGLRHDALFIIFITTMSAVVSLPTDLRGFWPLNNTHKLLDLSGHGTVMTKSSTVELSRGLWMELGGSYKFPGTSVGDYLYASPSAAIDVRRSISMFAWYYPLSNSSGPIINYEGPSPWLFGVHMWAYLNYTLFVRAATREPLSYRTELISHHNMLSLRRWDHVGYTYDYATGIQKLWHNGEVIKESNIGVVELTTQYGFRVGSTPGDARKLTGQVAGITIFSRALSEVEVREVMASFRRKEGRIRSRIWSAKFVNQKLSKHVISSSKVRSLVECTALCDQDGGCRSINYEYKRSLSKHTCELNGDVYDDVPSDLQRETGFKYLDRDFILET